jgi:hypothetical protein
MLALILGSMAICHAFDTIGRHKMTLPIELHSALGGRYSASRDAYVVAPAMGHGLFSALSPSSHMRPSKEWRS